MTRTRPLPRVQSVYVVPCTANFVLEGCVNPASHRGEFRAISLRQVGSAECDVEIEDDAVATKPKKIDFPLNGSSIDYSVRS